MTLHKRDIMGWVKKIGIGKNSVYENSARVQSIVNELNLKFPPAAWVPAAGYHVIPSAKPKGTGFEFDWSAGMVVKSFVNQQTGEVKSYNIQVVSRPPQ